MMDFDPLQHWPLAMCVPTESTTDVVMFDRERLSGTVDWINLADKKYIPLVITLSQWKLKDEQVRTDLLHMIESFGGQQYLVHHESNFRFYHR
jgi:hypothetical protein